MSDRISVTVVGGYLGSGKTTLVNHILREATERIALLVNDFGDINIDVDLIESRSEDKLELANGCICCSLVDGFAAALDKITALDPRPDRLVIEASGVSDPAQVAAYGHGPGLMMDAVVVLVDSETILDRLEDPYVGQTVNQQLTAANVVVLNKSDLVSDSQLRQLATNIQTRCPDAFVTAAEHSRVPTEVLFGYQRPPTATNHHTHVASDVFTTWTIERTEPMTRSEVAAMMDELPDTVVRAKGFVWLEESPDRPAVLQRVGKRWTLRRMGEWQSEPATKLAVIEVGV